MWGWWCRRPQADNNKAIGRHPLAAPLMQSISVDSPRLNPVADAVASASCGSRTMAGIKRAANYAAGCVSVKCLQEFSIAVVGAVNVTATYRNLAGSFGFFNTYMELGVKSSYALAAIATIPSIGMLANTTPRLVKKRIPDLYKKLAGKGKGQRSDQNEETALQTNNASKSAPKFNPYLSLGLTGGAFVFSGLSSTVLAQMTNTAFANTNAPAIANPVTRATLQDLFYGSTIAANTLGYGVKILEMGDVVVNIVRNFYPGRMQERYGKWVIPAYVAKAILSGAIVVASGFGVYSNLVNGEDFASTIGASPPGQLSYGIISAIPFFSMNIVEIFKLFGFTDAGTGQNKVECSAFFKLLHILASLSLAGIGAANTIYFTFQAEQQKMGAGSDPGLSWTLIISSGTCAFLSRYNITSEFLSGIEGKVGKLASATAALCFSRCHQSPPTPSSVASVQVELSDVGTAKLPAPELP